MCYAVWRTAPSAPGAAGSTVSWATAPSEQKQTSPVPRHRPDGRRRYRGRSQPRVALGDGTLRAWGLNASGQLLVTGLEDPAHHAGEVAGVSRRGRAIAAGADHSVALLADGTGVHRGERSRSARLRRHGGPPLAARVTGLPAIGPVGSGRDHTLAVAVSGQLWDWGQNDFGQLGDGTTTRRLSPFAVPGITDAIQPTAAGATRSCRGNSTLVIARSQFAYGEPTASSASRGFCPPNRVGYLQAYCIRGDRVECDHVDVPGRGGHPRDGVPAVAGGHLHGVGRQRSRILPRRGHARHRGGAGQGDLQAARRRRSGHPTPRR